MIVPEPDRALISKAVADRGLDLEDLREQTASSTWRVTVVVDGDRGVSLDELAELSTELDPLAEEWGGPARAVTLEVTSRGVDAPLTAPRHWRRARTRKVELTYVDGASGPEVARVGDLDETAGTLRVVARDGKRTEVHTVALRDVAKAVTVVEFGPPPAHELELLSAPEAGGRGGREGEDK